MKKLTNEKIDDVTEAEIIFASRSASMKRLEVNRKNRINLIWIVG